jgi:hypothetical protein
VVVPAIRSSRHECAHFIARTIEEMQGRGETIDWWERGNPERRRNLTPTSISRMRSGRSSAMPRWCARMGHAHTAPTRVGGAQRVGWTAIRRPSSTMKRFQSKMKMKRFRMKSAPGLALRHRFEVPARRFASGPSTSLADRRNLAISLRAADRLRRGCRQELNRHNPDTSAGPLAITLDHRHRPRTSLFAGSPCPRMTPRDLPCHARDS